MIRALLLKMSGIEGVSIEPVNWRQRSEAFGLFRKLRDARNEALHSSDMSRYRRLCRLSEMAWDRYQRRSGNASQGRKERKTPVAFSDYYIVLLNGSPSRGLAAR